MTTLKSHGDDYKKVIFISHMEATHAFRGLSEWSKGWGIFTFRLAADPSMQRNVYSNCQNHCNLEESFEAPSSLHSKSSFLFKADLNRTLISSQVSDASRWLVCKSEAEQWALPLSALPTQQTSGMSMRLRAASAQIGICLFKYHRSSTYVPSE